MEINKRYKQFSLSIYIFAYFEVLPFYMQDNERRYINVN
nr:MAG TPA: hypothetical protein [Caudoviricetes sp.]DAZ04870.1 MAG TPA: hypothetical protein [Caudoviricetes sp.]